MNTEILVIDVEVYNEEDKVILFKENVQPQQAMAYLAILDDGFKCCFNAHKVDGFNPSK